MALSSAAVKLTITRGGEDITIGNIAKDTTQAFIETRELDFGDPVIKKFLRRMLLWLSALDRLENVQVIIYGRNFITETRQELLRIPLRKLVPATVNLKETQAQPIPFRLPKRNLYQIRFEDNGVEAQWALYGFELWGRPAKGRF